ncbi:hypothetical protein EDD18DRAFT_1362061 [Armillaria luteobubalina]|uniref:DUF6534 domain-containing protein n=1 Tax=Armillaria luteobubalina TaxID=153913 RepID=A0AA39UHR5_9AGAR|nr:hypothetical protein EDD18DRAFT_1362061 [Armillaria luteobubalina]
MLPVPAGHPIQRRPGPPVVGYLLNWGLFGTLSIQLYLYYLAFPKDKRFVKSLVCGIYILELVQTILVTYDAFTILGYGFGDLDALPDRRFDWLVVPIMGGIAASVGQGFYAYRIFILSRSRIVLAFVIFVSLTSLVAAIIAGICTFQEDNIANINDWRMSISIGISCVGYALCDIAIAICMTYYLIRRKTSFHQTQILVTKLIRLIIETGSLTAATALVIPILYLMFPQQDFFMMPALIVSKLYANSTYMVLNSRIRIMGGRDTYTSSTDMEITSTVIRDITSHSTQDAQRTPVVTITAEVFTSDDEMGGMNVGYFDSRAFLELIVTQEKPQDGDMSLLA